MMLAKTILLGCVVLPLQAAADPTVLVGERVPFTAGELADAVKLRAQPSGDVRVTRDGDTLVVRVGDAEQTVSLCACDRRDVTRVVAMVIVALDGRGREPAARELAHDGDDREVPAALTASAPAPAHEPAFRRFAARLTIGRGRDDNGTFTDPITGALSFALTRNARLVASATIMKGTIPRPAEKLVPLQLGLEGRAGGAGLELGAFTAPVNDCFRHTMWSYGGYATGRVYVALTDKYRFVLEAHGYWAVDQPFGCDTGDWSVQDGYPMTGTPFVGTLHGKIYGGSLGAGLEWQL